MRIKARKKYLTRDGRIAGPARFNRGSPACLEYTVPLDGHPATYDRHGNRFSPGLKDPEDLVSEIESRQPKRSAA